MQMTLRWFGSGFDSIPLWKIRQVPGVTGVVSSLADMVAGEVWPKDRIRALKDEVEAAGLRLAGIESVNIPDSIKTATAERDLHIERYITTLERLGEAGIDLVCYNFMPVFDWTRTDLAKVRPDGATVMAYDQALIDSFKPEQMLQEMGRKSNNFHLPGWEPERLAKVRELFEVYAGIDEAKLFANLVYFLQAIMPTCARYGIKMAIHPDDPPWPVFGLPRIVTSKEHLLRIVRAVDHPCNGVTLCTGSLGSNPSNDLCDAIRCLAGRIHFAHVRNVKHTAVGVFEEAAHLSSDGSIDVYKILKAFHEAGFDGVMRPDHGRTIWGEVALPGYGLYDRAIGAAYLLGLWEAIGKN